MTLTETAVIKRVANANRGKRMRSTTSIVHGRSKKFYPGTGRSIDLGRVAARHLLDENPAAPPGYWGGLPRARLSKRLRRRIMKKLRQPFRRKRRGPLRRRSAGKNEVTRRTGRR